MGLVKKKKQEPSFKENPNYNKNDKLGVDHHLQNHNSNTKMKISQNNDHKQHKTRRI